MKAHPSGAGLLIYFLSILPNQAAEFMGLGHLDGGTRSGAHDVSTDGSVIVGWSGSTFAGSEPFRWTVSMGMESLGSISGGAFRGYATAVSADGSVIVGEDRSRFDSDGEINAFRWTTDSGKQILDTPAGSPYADYSSRVASAISADGSIVVGTGYIPLEQIPTSLAFRWTAETGTVDIGAPNFPTKTDGISADGRVIVGQTEFDTYGFAAAWTEEHGWTRLEVGDPLAGRSVSRAASADGSVIVGVKELWDSGDTAFRWTASGDLDFFTDPASGASSDAYDVSADGSIVVGTLGGPPGRRGAFIWDDDNGVRLVEDVLSAEGIDLTGWELSTARAVSADGAIIVGSGNNPDGNNEAWIANLSSGPVVSPVPDIKINGSDGPLTLTASDTLQLSLRLNNNGRTEFADWWLAGDSPYGFLFWTPTTGWIYDQRPAYQGRLYSMRDFRSPILPVGGSEPRVDGLVPGKYTLYFGVDVLMDGVISWPYLYVDSIEVSIVP